MIPKLETYWDLNYLNPNRSITMTWSCTVQVTRFNTYFRDRHGRNRYYIDHKVNMIKILGMIRCTVLLGYWMYISWELHVQFFCTVKKLISILPQLLTHWNEVGRVIVHSRSHGATCTNLSLYQVEFTQWPIKASENYSHYFCNHRVAELEGFLEQDCASEKVELPLMTVIQAAGQKDNLLDHPLSLEWGRFVTMGRTCPWNCTGLLFGNNPIAWNKLHNSVTVWAGC